MAVTTSIDLLRARVESIAIEVTSKCNLRCAYCHKADPELEALPGANEDMSDATIAALYRHCKAAGIRSVSLSVGGETTMAAGWHRRITQFLDDPEIDTHLVSNFTRPFDDDDLAALTRFRYLQVSFDSADRDMVRRLRGGAKLETITDNIARLRRKGRALGRLPFILVNCTVCRDNIGHIAKLTDLCRELEVDQLLLTPVRVVGEHNSKMPELLDKLTPGELMLLAEEIDAAEEILRGGATALRLQEQLHSRVAPAREILRGETGASDTTPRPAVTSSCRQPWTSPLVTASGNVLACCGGRRIAPVGNLASATLSEIVDGAAYRAVRDSILRGNPSVPCDGCSFAAGVSFDELVRDIREWQGDTQLPALATSITRCRWPGLLGSASYPVVVENARLTEAGEERIAIAEDRGYGLHRVLVDIDRAAYTELAFRARPAGRRRVRLDLADGQEMRARALIVLTARPGADVSMSGLECRVAAAADGWFDIAAGFPVPTRLSHLNLSLVREDNAAVYTGDGRSGLELSGVSLR